MNTPNNIGPESLPLKELKISSNKAPSGSPKHIQEKHVSNTQQQQPPKNPVILSSEKVAPKPPAESPKSAWVVKNETQNVKLSLPAISQPQTATVPAQVPVLANKQLTLTAAPAAIPNKVKPSGPTPFTNLKTIAKTTPPPAGVIVPQQTMPAKAPFASKPKKETNTVKPQEPQNVTDTVTETPPMPPAVSTPPQSNDVKPATPATVSKPNPPAAIAPAPIISKAPFSHARKPSITAETPASTPIPPPPAPTASDFPPPPAPRRVAPEPSAPVTIQVQSGPYAPSPVRSWASLFVGGRAAGGLPPNQAQEEIHSPGLAASNQIPSPLVNNVAGPQPPNQKPVAKVGPFDASPLQWEAVDKSANVSGQTISYSEKTSNGQVQKGGVSMKDDLGSRDGQQSQVPAHINDPNSYRMGGESKLMSTLIIFSVT